jgi:hypothetical protein
VPDFAGAAKDTNDVLEGLRDSGGAGMEDEGGGGGGGGECDDISWKKAAEEGVGVGNMDRVIASCGGGGGK